MKKALLGVVLAAASPSFAHPQFTDHAHSGSDSSWMIFFAAAVIAAGLFIWRRKGSL
ncbi:LPXTG cell wall anchor domain-containing protein [Rhodobacteraceae bacterium Araon29]